MIEARELRKNYGRTEAVKGVTFSVERGQVVGLLGPNGAGKTTIMKILTGYHCPSDGQALVDGIDVTDDPVAIKRRIGYLPESAPLYTDLTPAEYLDFTADARGLEGTTRKAAIDKAIESCSLGPVYHRPVEELSKGYRQRLGLAQAILHSPDILILDEPTTGLDPNQILEIRSLIRDLGQEKTVILSTHILQEVEAVCSRVLILNEGRIAAQGTAKEIGEALKGEERVSLRVKAKKGALEKKGLETLFDRLPVFGALRSLDSNVPGVFSAEISLTAAAGGGNEAGEAIFEWAVSEGLILLELVPHKLSLEEIFVKLTTEGGRE
ncbi:MAG: ATP-binding cassette domain-containing protein [Spirochaetota bacterium]